MKQLLCGWVMAWCSCWAYADSTTATLNVQMQLERACKINNEVLNNTPATVLGELNFGTVASHFRGTVATQLNNAFGGLLIQCSESTPVNIAFDAGLHSQSVPPHLQAAYYRAMDNGLHHYVAYNIVNAANNTVLKPSDSVAINASTTAQVLSFKGVAILDGAAVAVGDYTDTVAVSIRF